MDIAYGVSVYCASLLGSAITYNWLTKQATEEQKRDYPQHLLLATIGFGIFLFVMWLLPQSIKEWTLPLITLTLVLVNIVRNRKSNKVESQPPPPN